MIAFVPYICISYYCNPIADDFSFAARAREHDLLHLLFKSYDTWSGRYTANLFNYINPIAYNLFWLYKLTPIIIISSIIFSFNFLFKAIVRNTLRPIKRIIYSLAITLLFLYQMPLISEGIYWYTGSTSYTLGCASLLFLFGLLNLLFTKNYLLNSKYIHFFITVMVLFVTIGFSEIFMLLFLPFSALIYFTCVKKKLETKNIALVILTATVVFSLMNFFSPGNAARGSLYTNNHRFFYSLGMSFIQTARFFLSWISSIPLLLLSILYYDINKKLSVRTKLFTNSFYLNPYTSIGLLLFVLFIGSFPPYWATGILGQHRTMNISYFLFILLWFVCLTVFFNYKGYGDFRINKKVKLILFAFILSSLVFTKNGYHLILDLQSGIAKTYNNQMTGRYDLVKTEQNPIIFEPILRPPKTLYILDISESPTYWTNRCYNVFFEVDNEIVLNKK